MSAVSGVTANPISSLLNGIRPGGALSVTGLITGLNTDQIVTGLVAVQQAQVSLLEFNQKKLTDQQTAFKQIEARLLGLQAQVFSLARSFNGAFDSRGVTSSDPDVVTAAASGSASAGVYALKVNSTAKAHQVASQGFISTGSSITQGTIQLKVGSGPTANLTIDSTNNTLAGLATAINNANVGVTATLVNDGTGIRATRLLLTANQTGSSNSITLTNNLAANAGGAVRPVFDATYVGPVDLATGFSGTSAVTSNSGSGAYTSASNGIYTFTVQSGGTVGTTNGIQISYTDESGQNTGTITLDSTDVDVFKNAGQGIQVKFAAGTLVAGDKFTIKGYVPNVQSAANASVSLGTGAGALTVQSTTNQVENVLSGVTIKVLSADPTKTVNLNISNDVDKATKAVQDFVSAYNDLVSAIAEQTSFDPETGAAGLLLGNGTVVQIQDQVRNALSGAVSGLNPLANRLSAIGITFDSRNRLVLDSNKLQQALAGQISGVTFADVRSLFSLAGKSTHPGIVFINGSSRTTITGKPIQVSISQAATQASITAANALAASTVIDNSNNNVTISVDGGTSGTITLAPGTYAQQALAQELQAQINADKNLVGRQVAVSLSNSKLSITANSYGSSSQVRIGTGTALPLLGFAGSEFGAGSDVVGKYIVDGVAETAVGTGQILRGSASNKNTADLVVRAALTPAQVGSGLTADLTVTRGVASQVDSVLQKLLDPISGRLKTIAGGYDTQIDDVKLRIARQNALIELRKDSLLRQFASLEATVSRLQSAGNFLAAQAQALSQLQNRAR